ncbi:hypothetical protein [Mesorhizobium sp. J8]|uniref:hypothetical protein n=1 Tax=Mesorhizobium sp. J8 TaxID=2777475 RepID=UPI001915E9F4|nr:hypothetical protein [Mesorhizobium sp. J8]
MEVEAAQRRKFVYLKGIAIANKFELHRVELSHGSIQRTIIRGLGFSDDDHSECALQVDGVVIGARFHLVGRITSPFPRSGPCPLVGLPTFLSPFGHKKIDRIGLFGTALTSPRIKRFSLIEPAGCCRRSDKAAPEKNLVTDAGTVGSAIAAADGL